MRFYQLIQLSKIAGLNLLFASLRRLVPDEALEFLKPKIKNPALSAGRIRHTWTNSLVAQLMSTLSSVADLASSSSLAVYTAHIRRGTPADNGKVYQKPAIRQAR